MFEGGDPNKAKTARRVVEVLEYFDAEARPATVMDIARRYGRPQSSTSELLATLVEMGLLQKDPRARTFRPTPRAALLGGQYQPAAIRDGRLSALVERLAAETGLGVAVIGMVGRSAQVFRWLGDADLGIGGGSESLLHQSAAGWLLLSTLAADRRDGLLRRLRADAAEHERFDTAAVVEQVVDCARQGWAVGPAGSARSARMCAVLLPGDAADQAIVVAVVFKDSDAVDTAAVTVQLRRTVQDALGSRGEQVVQLDDYRTRRGEDAEPQPLIPAKAGTQAAVVR